ncbi:single strand DNA binding protein [Rhizobium phage RHEph06]|uniref:DUF669 domain-containing NTP-binding protein n=4 Tax=Kleczkowskavirus RHEph4 TaxID=1921526 RepID=A0A7S5R216_9CAUD|nr:single strand DNA binding protein [Rhizobium phage RHEph06]YP_009598512.1 single strand DNA binding protein [Rhizobium phage RHEph04]AGC35832.1 hypothetical protein RHEph05_gp065 [Rhizobium phage RHEph05]QIG67696.1 DUF669 domain-containing NTP-binding protein [Rhizobium phage RHph_Y17]QIG69015.1 DUF669 domain-containing NTP-binding protein [Rhizobium phage RHph_Y3_43]QIG69564.1 DUF669 domain-containing NTP-binding protein [Rhizobium phage RHph_I36]QIG75438.1 DUF669 domain-containing NTP-bi
MVAINFNASTVKPNVALEAIPSGLYPVIITKTEEKPTKSGQGSYIEVEMTVQGGEFANRKIFDRLNIRNPNQTAVDIAYATLSAICHVTGVLNMTDTVQLHGRPFQAVVSKIPRDDRPDQMTNEVKGYKDVNGNDPGFSGTVANPSAQPGWAQQQPQQQQPAPAPQPQYQQQPPQTQPAAPAQQPPQPAPTGAAPNWAQPAAAAPTAAPSWAQQ